MTKWKSIQFGFAAFGTNLISVTLGAILLSGIYCIPGAELVDKLLATTLLAVASVWDAIIDPYIGYFSDNLRTKIGRRRPLFLLGAPMEALAFILLLLPPKGWDTTAILAYMILFRTVFFTFHSMVCVSYDTLIAEIGHTSAERVRLSGLKSIFAQIGVLVGSLVAGILIGISPLLLALVVGILGFVMIYLTLPVIPKSIPQESGGPQVGPLRSILSILGNGQFLILFFTTVIYIIGQGLLTSNLEYLTQLVGGQPKGRGTLVLAGAVVIMMTCAVIFIRLGRKYTPKKLFRFCLLAFSCASLLGFFAGQLPGVPPFIQCIGVVVLMAPWLAGCLIFGFVLLGNIIDHDQAASNRRREAEFYGAYAVSSGVGSALAFQILGLCHLAGDTAENPFGVRLVYLVLACLLLVAFLIMGRFKLKEVESVQEG